MSWGKFLTRVTFGLKAVGSLTIMNLRALNTALSVSVRFSQSLHMHASLQNSPAPADRTEQSAQALSYEPSLTWAQP